MSVDPTRIAISLDPRTQRMSGTAIHGNTPFDVPYISHIEGNLWTGGCSTGLVLPDDFEHVVSLYPWEQYEVGHRLKSYSLQWLYDSEELPDRRRLWAIARFSSACVEDGPTLVHCQAGLNRSGLIGALVLMLRGRRPQAAIDFLREQRSPAVLCNQAFEAWLLSFDAEGVAA